MPERDENPPDYVVTAMQGWQIPAISDVMPICISWEYTLSYILNLCMSIGALYIACISTHYTLLHNIYFAHHRLPV